MSNVREKILAHIILTFEPKVALNGEVSTNV